MPFEKRVKDLMISLEDYPHIPYWYTLRQAAVIMREAAIKFTCSFEPRAILVFDEKYHLLGILNLKDIINGLEPQYLKSEEPIPESSSGKISWRDLFGPTLNKEAEKPVSEVLSPIKVTLDVNDPLAKALALMVKENEERIPVLKNDRVVGLIRMSDLFREISQALIENEPLPE